MDEHKPGEQFEATDYDEDGNIKLPPPPVAAEKKKRLTVVDLAKRFGELEKDIDATVFESLSALDTRLDKIEEDIARRIGPLSNSIDHRIDELETEINDTISNEMVAMANTIDNNDQAIGAVAAALKSHIKEAAATPPEPAAEIEFAQPPVQMAGETADISATAVVAAVCQTMTDVLTITRALKEVPELTDAERNEILYIAGRASGVVITPGLQIRAGVRNVEA